MLKPLCNVIVVIFCYFQKENCKVLKFYVNNFFFFEVGASPTSAASCFCIGTFQSVSGMGSIFRIPLTL